MKTTLLALTILVGYGCSGMSFKELERKALNCNESEEARCEELHALYEKRLEQRNKIEERKKDCPPGMIKMSDGSRMGCMRRDDFDRWRRWSLPF